MKNKKYQKLYNELKIKHAIELATLELNFENYIDLTNLFNSLYECKNFSDKEIEYILKESKKNIKKSKISL